MLSLPDPGWSQRPAFDELPVSPLAAVAAGRGGFFGWLDGIR